MQRHRCLTKSTSLFSLLSLVPLAIYASACSGTAAGDSNHPQSNVDDAGATQDSGSQSDTGTIVQSGTEGSFDLEFTQVINSATTDLGTPSRGNSARLDLRKNADGTYDAVLTPRWGGSMGYTVYVEAQTMTLQAVDEGDGSEGAAFFDGAATTDSYGDFVVTITNDQLSSFSATGTQNTSQGDQEVQNQLSASGSVAKDTTKPAVSLNVTSNVVHGLYHFVRSVTAMGPAMRLDGRTAQRPATRPTWTTTDTPTSSSCPTHTRATTPSTSATTACTSRKPAFASSAT